MNKKLISVLLVVMMILALVGCGQSEDKADNGETTPKAGVTTDEEVVTEKTEATEAEQGITAQDIAAYGLEVDTPWINVPVGIVYDIPQDMIDSGFYGSLCLTYMHGCSHRFLSRSSIYVEKSLEGKTDLETLANDIIAEKNSEKYAFVYEFGLTLVAEFQNAKTEKVRINGIDTVYFESEEIPSEDGPSYKFVGYSFEYMGQYISAYGVVYIEDNDLFEELVHTLQYMISSVRSHNNETIQELGGNVHDYFDDGGVSRNETVTVNAISGHSLHGILQADADRPLVEPTLENFEWDGRLETIFESSLKVNPRYHDDGSSFPDMYLTLDWVSFERDDEENWYNKAITEILTEEKITINNIDMIKYVIKTSNEYGHGYYIVAYMFISDGQPYIVNYMLSRSLYKGKLQDKTEEQTEMLIRQTEAVCDSFIYTIRVLGPDEKWTDYIDLH